MNPIPDIKRFMLRTLAAWGLPVPTAQISRACQEGIMPRPLGSDMSEALRQLEADGFVQGNRDDLDETLITWALTEKGKHKAKQLG